MALEAVIGVLGVLVKNLLGGVNSASPSMATLDGYELILVAVGVLRGCKLKGGRRIGCNVLLLIGGRACGASPVAIEAVLGGRRCIFPSEEGVEGFSGLVFAEGRGRALSVLSRLPARLVVTGVFVPAKKGVVVSSRSLGDS